MKFSAGDYSERDLVAAVATAITHLAVRSAIINRSTVRRLY
jgi:hypothetical protein